MKACRWISASLCCLWRSCLLKGYSKIMFMPEANVQQTGEINANTYFGSLQSLYSCMLAGLTPLYAYLSHLHLVLVDKSVCIL